MSDYQNKSDYIKPNEQKKVSEWLYDTKWIPTNINNALLNISLINSLDEIVSKETFDELSGYKLTTHAVKHVLMTPSNAYKYMRNLYGNGVVDDTRKEYIIKFISNYTNIFVHNDTFYKVINEDLGNNYISPMTNLFLIFNILTKDNPTEKEKLNDTKKEFYNRMQILINNISNKISGNIDALNKKILEENQKITDLNTRHIIWKQRVA